VSESAPQSETYAWDGHYYFNKATGAGGVYVENFRFGGQTGDPTSLPGFPDEYRKYFSSGRGGVQAVGDVQADPRCATKPNPSGPSGGGSGGGASGGRQCRVAGGRIRRGIDNVALGMKRAAARSAQGMPITESSRWMTWCFERGGNLAAAFGGGAAELVWTNSRPFSTERVHTTSSAGHARRMLQGERRLGSVRGATIFVAHERKRQLVVGLRSGHVGWMAIARRNLSKARLLSDLRTLR
jgi:hypothetical protein